MMNTIKSHPIYSILVAVLFTLFASSQLQASEERAMKLVSKTETDRRIALVIGNSSYTNLPLNNPVNDANDMASKLRGLGFEVVLRNNMQTKQIGGTLREFRSKLTPGAVALVFYAGHGLQIKGDNYLPSVDADINSEEDVPNQSLSVRQIMDVLEESRTRLNLVFLDACRNNPYASRSFRSADRGLARIAAPSGTLISYATKPGSVAADGDGRNGLYTSKLLTQLDSPLQIELALKRVVTEVKSASQGKQEPWMEGSIEGDFCFSGCTNIVGNLTTPNVPVAVADNSVSASPAEIGLWDVVQKSNTRNDFNSYLTKYPKGKYASQAKVGIEKIQAEETAKIVQEDKSAWEAANTNNTKESYANYLNKYPKGIYALLAEDRIIKKGNCLFPSTDVHAPGWVCGEPIDGVDVSQVGIADKSNRGEAFMKKIASMQARAYLLSESCVTVNGTSRADEKTRETIDRMSLQTTCNNWKEVNNQLLNDSREYKSVIGPDGSMYLLEGMDVAASQNLKKIAHKNYKQKVNAFDIDLRNLRFVLMPIILGKEYKSQQKNITKSLVNVFPNNVVVIYGDDVENKSREISMQHSASEETCINSGCILDIAESFQATLIVQVAIVKSEGHDSLYFTITDVSTLIPISTVSYECFVCDFSAMENKLLDISRDFLAKYVH